MQGIPQHTHLATGDAIPRYHQLEGAKEVCTAHVVVIERPHLLQEHLQYPIPWCPTMHLHIHPRHRIPHTPSQGWCVGHGVYVWYPRGGDVPAYHGYTIPQEDMIPLGRGYHT